MALSCDVAKERDVQHAFEEMERHLGQVNFLVNAAGINRSVTNFSTIPMSFFPSRSLWSIYLCASYVVLLLTERKTTHFNTWRIHNIVSKILC